MKNDKIQKRGYTSIIIPVHNQIAYTELCMESLVKCTSQDAYELIVIDNASTDKTPQFLATTSAKVIRLEENSGVAPAWNRGIGEAKGEFMAFIHNDVILAPDWLHNTLRQFENPDIWCVSPRTSQRLLPPSFSSLVTAISKTPSNHIQSNIERSCFVLRSSAIDEVGCFDENFQMHYYEEADLQLRLTKAGHPPVQATNVAVHHFESRTTISIPGFISKYLSRNWTYFHEKWNLPSLPSPAEYPEFGEHLAKLKLVRPPRNIPETKIAASPGKPKVKSARIIACIIVFNEVELLPDCLNSLLGVDEIRIVDGAYRDFPHEKPWSTDGTIELVKEMQKTDGRIKLITCTNPWKDEVEKRNAYFDSEDGDANWYLQIDADEQVAGYDPETNPLEQLKTYLSSSELDCLSLQVRGPFRQTSIQQYARVFRRIPRIRYEACHYNVVGDDNRYLWNEVEEGGNLLLYPGFYLLHNDHLRNPVRSRDARLYYEKKDVKEVTNLAKLIVRNSGDSTKSMALRTWIKMYQHLISQIPPKEAAEIAVDPKYLKSKCERQI